MKISANQISEAADYISQKTNGFQPEIGMILGSGMGILADEVEVVGVFPYKEIPGFPSSTVKGHAGRLVLGHLEGKKVMVMQGRFHYYEGHPIQMIGFPIRVMHLLGIKVIMVTNAAGTVNPEAQPGDLMLIRDHINGAFHNPLSGPNLADFGPRFPDTSRAYSQRLRDLAQGVANSQGFSLREGVYQFNTGPSYETPAEVVMARKMGADAVGMSTVPEVLTAAHCGIEVLGISYISNLAAGISETALSHKEVIENMEAIKDKFIALVRGIVKKI